MGILRDHTGAIGGVKQLASVYNVEADKWWNLRYPNERA